MFVRILRKPGASWVPEKVDQVGFLSQIFKRDTLKDNFFIIISSFLYLRIDVIIQFSHMGLFGLLELEHVDCISFIKILFL